MAGPADLKSGGGKHGGGYDFLGKNSTGCEAVRDSEHSATYGVIAASLLSEFRRLTKRVRSASADSLPSVSAES